MLSKHSSGLSVISAPSRPAEMRSFDPLVVTRLLDLVSANFDYVVIDMPRTWFSWTDDVLLGSNRLHIVGEMTVPCLKLAKNLLSSIKERLGEGCRPQVIVNRFEQRMFTPGLKLADIEKAFGPAFGGMIPNNYRVVREAIDRGVPLEEVKPGNNVTAQLKKIVIPHAAKAGKKPLAAAEKKSSSFLGAELNMLGRFTSRQARVARAGTSTGDRIAVFRLACSRTHARSSAGRQSAAHRQTARRQGASASAIDRGDQSFGARKIAAGRNEEANRRPRLAICDERAPAAEHQGTFPFRRGNSRRDDRPWPAGALLKDPTSTTF